MGRPPRWSLVALGPLVLVTLSRSAQAQTALPLSVEREPGAEDCPDGPALAAAVTAIVGEAPLGQAPGYSVTFGSSPQGLTAAIRSRAAGGVVRHLEAREPSCAALAHATAVTLALLFDAELGTEPQPDPPAAAAQPVAPAPPAAVPPAPPRPASLEPMLSFGGAALVGVLRPVAPALVADLGFEREGWRASLGALGALPQTSELAPGSVRQQLLGANLRVCYAAARGGALRLDVCSGALLGAATAEARGFTTSARHTKSFLAFPAELAVSSRSRFIGWQASASALLLAPPNEFTVAGVGPVYRPAALAGLFTLRLFLQPFR